MLYPLKFSPVLKSVIWGGDKITQYKGIDSDQEMVGESWEISAVEGSETIVSEGSLAGRTLREILKEYGAMLVGRANYAKYGDEFPILVKFIDACDDLSIQVHPNDELAAARHNSKGKSEMWYVISSDEGAKLRSGLSREITQEGYIESVENGTLTDMLCEYDVVAGDLFYLPAGRIHSIGKGCFIAEIQQSSAITYRIYDFDRRDSAGNPRELHTAQAVDAIDYNVEKSYRTDYERGVRDREVELVDSPFFHTSLLELSKPMEIDYSTLDSFVIYTCVDGELTLNSDITLGKGENLLLPATTTRVSLESDYCKILVTQS